MNCTYIIQSGKPCGRETNGSNRCSHHGGNIADEIIAREESRNYDLQRYRARLATKADAPNIKSLTEEIGILRLMIEARLNACADDNDLMMQSSAIALLINSTDKLISSSHKMDFINKNYVSKGELAQFATEVVTIVNTYVKDPDVLEAIANAIIAKLDEEEPEAF